MTDADPAFPLLEAYLAALHTGDEAARARLLADHPELAQEAACLEALDRLAPPPPPDSASAATILHDQATAPEPAAVPATFGPYELLGELGRGGMGVVYKARHRQLDRLVALKMILGHQLAGAELVERFHTEARAAARVRHPHIVQVYETGQHHGQHYFAMEFVAGQPLDALLAAGPLGPKDAARLLAPIARAVGHLHANGLVHRDLKPSNVLLDADGRPVLTDFGLVKLLEANTGHTVSGAILGTPSYMAPEQAAGRRAVGPAADIYGLGAILYECLTGAPPFRGPTPLDTLVLVLEGEPVPPRQQNPALPRDLELVCLKCLEKDPAARYPSAAALADDLERFLHGEGVEVRPRGPVDRVVRWARREPALASRLGGLAVFAAIAQANYLAGATVTAGQNLLIQGLLLFWAAGSWLCAAGAHRPRWAARVPFVWTGIDLTALTAILAIRHSGASPLLIGYPAIVVAAGLWFRVPLVWFATAAAGLAYAVLVALTVPAEVLRHDPHHPALFVAILGVIGFLCAYQVQRVRVLSRYYESRPGVSS